VYVNLNQFDIDKYQDGEKCVEMVESGRFKSSCFSLLNRVVYVLTC